MQAQRYINQPLLWMFAALLISVAVRWPNIDRPLSKHHEFCTAVALRVLQTWDEVGIDQRYFVPSMNFENATDKFVNNHASTSGNLVDAEGNFYYTSHPPMGYYWPFFSFQLFDIAFTARNLQLFNMLMHFLSGLFVYFIVALLAHKRPRGQLYWPAFAAFLLYLFNPASLWFSSNVYMSDIAVQYFFVPTVYVMLKLIVRRRLLSIKYLFFLGVLAFLMCYTSWLGYFVVFVGAAHSIFKTQETRRFFIPAFVLFIGAFFALQLTIYQYAQINGLYAYATEMANRFAERGPFYIDGHSFGGLLKLKAWELWQVIKNYLTSYVVFFIVLVMAARVYFNQKRMRVSFSYNGYRFIIYAVVPVVLMHLVLLNYSHQDFTTLYASLFFSVLLGIWYEKLNETVISAKRLKGFTVLVCFLMIGQYYAMNLPGNYSIKGHRYDTQMKLGKAIQNESNTNERLYYLGAKADIDPQVIWYAQRNILSVDGFNDALTDMEAKGFTIGRIFYTDSKGDIKSKHFEI